VPGGSSIELDDELSKKGVIFTDLITAEKKYPDRLLAKMAGKTVNPEEGKFAAWLRHFLKMVWFYIFPKGVSVEAPLHSMLWGPGANLAHISHLIGISG